MGQVERGANRIYGIARDRPSLHKYGRAAVLAVVAGLPAMLGFLLIVAGSAAAESLEQVYGVDRTLLRCCAGRSACCSAWPRSPAAVLPLRLGTA
jgi:uncharacterized BrkB/YihY/UPF0761 family membrane protein